MLLIIHNLPINSKYADIKALIQSKCGLSEVILDNLVNEGQTKRVTVGLADDGDAAILVRKINGLYINGQQLYVEDVRQKKESEQPYRSSKSLIEPQEQLYDQFSSRDAPQNTQNVQDATLAYQNQNAMNMMMNYNMAAMGGVCFMPPMPQPQNSYLGYGGQQQMAPLMPQAPEIHAPLDRPFGFGVEMVEENMRSERQRQPYGNRRRTPSPPRGKRSNDDRRSRWDESKPEGRFPKRRRSRSPLRGRWNSREQSDRPGPSNDYYKDLMTRNFEPENYGHSEPEFYPNNSLNFGGSQVLEEPPSNIFGSHVTQPAGSRWDAPSYGQNQYNKPDFNHRSRNDSRPRGGGNNTPQRSGFKSFESRNSNRDGPGASGFPPKRFNKKWDNDEPQAKKFAPPKASPTRNEKNWREPVMQKPTPSKFVPKVSKPGFTANPNDPEEMPLEKLLNRDETYRGQAASSLAKDMVRSLKVEISFSNPIFTQLKYSIRDRINVMLGDQISKHSEQIVEMYHAKFPSSGDQEFFLTVLDTLNDPLADEDNKPRAGQSGSMKPKPEVQGPAGPKPVKVPAAKPVKKQPAKPAQQPPQGDRLPRFPTGDKITNKQMKAEEKKEWREDNFVLPEDQKKALDKEIDVLSDIFMTECMNPDNELEKPVCEQIGDIVTDDFRKVLRISLSKRLLNITKNLIVRLHATIKAPMRDAVDKYLKSQGCISLQKSDRKGQQLYLAHFDTYENYDKILAMGYTNVDGLPIVFKPFQLCGPPPSASVIGQQHRNRKMKFIQSQIDNSDENILQPGYVYQPKAGKDSSTNDTNEIEDNQENEETDNIEEQNKNDKVPIENVDADDGEDDEPQENFEGNKNMEDVDDIDDNVDEDDLEDY